MNMNVNFQPSFLGLKTFKHNNVRLLEPYTAISRDSKKLNLAARFEPVNNMFETIVTADHRNFDWIGYSQYSINKNYMYIESMHTDSFERDIGIGTCLHLNNIIEMLKNNVDLIELSASAPAIPFHIRFGFRPCDVWTDNMVRNLRHLASNKDYRFKKFSEDAKFILSNQYSNDLKARLANQLIADYVNESLACKTTDELKQLMRSPTKMSLTRSDVFKNKDFYNKLLKKYNIDYKIEG